MIKKSIILVFYLALVIISFLIVNAANITILNLGLTGIESSNQEFTSSKTVILDLNFSRSASTCRYTNYPTNDALPASGYDGWTPWELCVGDRIWQLSNDTGLKTVFYKINISGSHYVFNDTIYYNYTGAGLDNTPPLAPYVYHKNFTNNIGNFTIFWANASDPESDILHIPVYYNVYLYNESNVLLDNTVTTDESYTFELGPSYYQSHGVSLYANVTVVNSAGLKNSAISNNLVVDTIGPTISNLEGSLLNLSSSSYWSINNETLYVYATTANFTWEATDSVSEINAFSYVINKNSEIDPDQIPEGSTNSLNLEKTNTQSNLPSGKYYFSVKARDLAGNWGSFSSINFSIDNSAPSTSTITSSVLNLNNITYTWSESTDAESSMSYYQVNLTDSNGILNQTRLITDLNNRQCTFSNLSDSLDYEVNIYAFNNVGIYSSSSEVEITGLDTTPPTVFALPNSTVVKNYPILKAWTNEQAICFYNLSNEYIEFKYTNTSYHETKLSHLANNAYEYKIQCKDNSGNTAPNYLVNFDIDSSMTPETITIADFSTYENIVKSVTVKITNLSNELTGYKTDDFTLLIEGDETEFTLFDIGDSNYNLTFITPDSGSYTLTLRHISSNVEGQATLTVNGLKFYTSYNDLNMGSSIISKTRIAFFDGTTRFGLATETNLDLSSESFNNIINFSSEHSEENYIFNTKKSENILSREKYLENQDLVEQNLPSFGYDMSNNYMINFIISSNDFNINSTAEKLSPGKYLYLVKLRKNAGKKEVFFDDD